MTALSAQLLLEASECLWPQDLLPSNLLVVIEWRGSSLRTAHVVQSFCRKLVWHRECLWPQDLPPCSLLVLEAADDLVPCQLARAVHNKLKHPCDVRFCTHLQVPAAAQYCLFV